MTGFIWRWIGNSDTPFFFKYGKEHSGSIRVGRGRFLVAERLLVHQEGLWPNRCSNSGALPLTIVTACTVLPSHVSALYYPDY